MKKILSFFLLLIIGVSLTSCFNFAEKYVGGKPKSFAEIIEAIRVNKD